MTMSLSKLMAGRKRESGVWKWFDYDENRDKSVCLVKLKTGKLKNAVVKINFSKNIFLPHPHSSDLI